MGFWRSLVRSMKGPRQGQSLVEEQDLHMLCMALEWRAERIAGATPEEPERTAERLSTRAASLPLQELRTFVRQRVERQVRELLGDESTCGFKLDIRASSIPNAGRGVFAKGEATPGQVVALMPGLVYRKDHHRDIPGYPSFGDESMLLMSRHDGHVIDSRAWECFIGNKMLEYNTGRRKRDGQHNLDTIWFHPDLRKHPSALAMGHVINHPPEGVAPNVLPAPVDWTDRDVSRIPWSLYQISGDVSDPLRGEEPDEGSNKAADGAERGVVPGLAFVATRHIDDGEELFVNYRLNPGVLGGLPKWYVSVDEEEDLLRWG